MKLPVIKTLIENYSLEQLVQAEADLMDEKTLQIEVEGEDEGEQLTHLMAAIWIKNDMEVNHTDMRVSMRNYTQKVRESIT